MKKQFLSLLGVMLLTIFSLQAQEIKGKVYDAQSGRLLPKVTVQLLGTDIQTTTLKDGSYSINLVEAYQELEFRKKGYETQTIKASGRTIIDVHLVLQAGVEAEMDEEPSVRPALRPVKEEKRLREDKAQMRVAPMGGNTMAKTSFMVACDQVQPNWNTEGYSAIHENGFKQVGQHPLSTFSVDVDAASYANVRRFLNNSTLPPKDAVRIEELINYFSYDYAQAKGDDPFSIQTELAACPWNTDHLLLHVGLQGERMENDALPASNIVFLLDVSGSMNASNKLPLLKTSFSLLIDQLRKEDRVAIVVYAGNSGLVLPSTSGSDKQAMKDALNRLSAGGSTAGGAGLQLAYKVASENFIEGGNNRIILATDGDFNVGSSSNAEMERLIEKERERGIGISVLGFGMGNYKDDKMEIIADKGNGNYAYIDNLMEAKKVLVNEFGGTLFTIAKDVKFQLEFNPATVKSYRLIGYENRLLNTEDFEDDKKDAGEIGAGHTVTALYEIVPADEQKVNGALKYQQQQLSPAALKSNDLITLKLRYKKPDGYQSILLEQTVKNSPLKVQDCTDNFLFSAAVAQYGMLLRNSEFKGEASWENTLAMAKKAKGRDAFGYRAEFIQLVQKAALLQSVAE